MKKKIISLLLVLILIIGLTGCDKNPKSEEKNNNSKTEETNTNILENITQTSKSEKKKLKVISKIDVKETIIFSSIKPAIEFTQEYPDENIEDSYQKELKIINSLNELKYKKVIKYISHQIEDLYALEYSVITSEGELYIVTGDSEYNGLNKVQKVKKDYKITDLYAYYRKDYGYTDYFNSIVYYGEGKYFYLDNNELKELDIDNYEILNLGDNEKTFDNIILRSNGKLYQGDNIVESNLKDYYIDNIFITDSDKEKKELYCIIDTSLYIYNINNNKLDRIGNIKMVEYDKDGSIEKYLVNNTIYSFVK